MQGFFCIFCVHVPTPTFYFELVAGLGVRIKFSFFLYICLYTFLLFSLSLRVLKSLIMRKISLDSPMALREAA